MYQLLGLIPDPFLPMATHRVCCNSSQEERSGDEKELEPLQDVHSPQGTAERGADMAAMVSSLETSQGGCCPWPWQDSVLVES